VRAISVRSSPPEAALVRLCARLWETRLKQEIPGAEFAMDE
jgi:hypothetical protein